METLELLAIAIGVSMDAFAVAICQGLSTKKMSYKYAVITGCFFGGFQALMPSIGYLLGKQFKDYIISIDHWIIFILLSIIGLKMIKEAKGVCMVSVGYCTLKTLLVLALATSIDALAIGVTFAFLHVDILFAVSIIGITTFLFSFVGVKIGNILGEKFQAKAEMVGGIILIVIGTKILLEHLNIIS